MGKRGPKPINQDTLEMMYGAWRGVFEGMRSGRYIRKGLDFKDEHEFWIQLLNAKTVPQVRAVCEQSTFWLNPKRGAVIFHRILFEHAKTFLAAKKDPRWPKSDRPTSQGRRNRFLARSMAGVSMGISIRTAQDLLARTDKDKSEKLYRPVCDCGHLEQDHKDRHQCKYCSCVDYRYSGGRETSE